RFSYYGGRALLVLFMTAAVNEGGLGFTTQKAGAIYALYAGSVYLLALWGGWAADRLMGQQKAVWYGGILISAGNFVIAIPSEISFYLGLILIIMGTGLLKPNVSTIVGDLYANDTGARRDAGFSIFYMGINLGAFIAPLVSGTVGETTTWRWGFATAGVAMVLGLIQYRWTLASLGDAGKHPDSKSEEQRSRGWKLFWGSIAVMGVVVLLGVFGVIPLDVNFMARGVGVVIMGLAVYFFAYVLIFGDVDPVEKKRIGVIAIFAVAAAVFWGGFEQAATTFNLFARDYTDRSFLGGFFDSGVHPATWYQSVNPVFIILLSPVFAWIWIFLAQRNLEPSAPVKFAIGLVQLGLGFGVIMFAAKLAIESDVAPTWLLLTYLLHTTGELCLSPIGLSYVTKLSPHRYVGQMMGTWFMAAGFGNVVAGLIGGHVGGIGVEALSGEFMKMTIFGIGFGVFLLILSGPIRNWMGGVK
ncbi:MAG: peptide MFS transporter, partial [Gammaproteobacteria bacterium]|nr:peptide MFS transporter [Gammaproteobacteria bacterium]